KRIMVGEPDLVRKYKPRVPADLQAVVMKCLEKDPARRYPTARELSEDLGRFLAREPVRARPAGAVRRGWRWARRRPLVLAGAAAVLLALAAAGWGAWYWDRHARVKIAYYATFVNRRGIAEGVGRLTPDQVRHRNYSLKFYRKGGRLEKV